jgi:hypothetical protein
MSSESEGTGAMGLDDKKFPLDEVPLDLLVLFLGGSLINAGVSPACVEF